MRKLILAILFLFASSLSIAAPRDGQQAKKAVRGWLKSCQNKPMDVPLSQVSNRVDTFVDSNSEPVYHIVYLKSGGYVVVPADDEVEPIVAFSSQGEYDPSFDNPMGSLVDTDISDRVTDAHKKRHDPSDPKNAQFKNARFKWQKLQSLDDQTLSMEAKLASVTDVRVPPLVKSKWNQGSESGNLCYNIYTPKNRVCGCVATAMAQLMRFHQYPATPTTLGPFTIHVDGVAQKNYLMGNYDWANMVLNPNSSTTLQQRQAIGTLTYDAGVSVGMSYSSGGSGASTLDGATAFKNIFAYQNAVKGYNSGNNIPKAYLVTMLNPNLDAGFPCLLAIRSSSSGHAIVCDGYGYNSLTLYHHLNMGWGGSSDAWYDLPDIGSFTSVNGCVYNVFVSGTGQIISGQVTDVNGQPVAAAEVSTNDRTFTAVTNEKGIYALKFLPANSSYTLNVTKPSYVFTPITVKTGVNSNPATGNVWKANIVGYIAGAPFAKNGSACTKINTAVLVTMASIDDGLPDPPASLKYIIASLPEHGTLTDPSAASIDSVPYILTSGNLVEYIPDADYTGNDTFQFKANDGGIAPQGGDSNIAKIFITVIQPAADPNLVGWWTFDDNCPDYAWDHTGKGNHGTIFNATYSAGRLGTALNFAPDMQCYVDIPPSAFSTLNDQVTISLWQFGSSSLPTACTIFIGDDASANRILNAHIPWSNGAIIFDAGSLGSEYDRFSKAANPNQYKGQWNHWAFTKNSAIGQMKIYYNGQLWASASGKTKLMSGIKRFKIGSVGGLNSFYDGLVDDFRVYDRELPIEKISQLAENYSAYNFSPANGASAQTTVLLDWDCAAVNPLFDVYLSTDFKAVDQRLARVAKGISLSEFKLQQLPLDSVYYWAVDVNDYGTTWKSEISNFSTPSVNASNPRPGDGSINYVAPAKLNWTVSSMMINQDVYFGTDINKVRCHDHDPNYLIADNIVASSCYLPNLTKAQTYYWQIETNSTEGVNSSHVWSFTLDVRDPNFIGWWEFEDSNNLSIADSSGYGHTGTLAGNALLVDDPERGKVLSLDGSGDYVTLGSDSWTNPGNHMTVSAWFKVKNFNLSYQCIVAKGNKTYRLQRDATNSGLCVYMNYASTSTKNISGTTSVNDDSWHHAAATYDGTVIKLFVDGIQEGDPVAMSSLFTISAPLMIGKNSDQPDRDWQGWIDDVRLYNRPLSTQEIWSLAGIDPVYDNFRDMVNNWLNPGPGDLNSDGIVNARDFAIMAPQWGWNKKN